MASNRRWRPYKPPVEQRNESGQPTRSGGSGGSGAGTAAGRKPSGTRRPARKPATTRPSRSSDRASSKKDPTPPKKGLGTRAWIYIALVVIGPLVIAGIIAAARSGDDGGAAGNPDIDTKLLNEGFITRSLANAAAEEGDQPVSVRVSEYGVSVEYFDPNTKRIRTVETNGYSDGYDIRVRPGYDDYAPQRFALDLADPDAMIAAVEDALEEARDGYSFDLRIDVQPGTTGAAVVTMTASVSAPDRVEIATPLATLESAQP